VVLGFALLLRVMPGGTVMRTQKVCLLICLSIWCQFDDVLLVSLPSAQSAPFTDEDDDEYLSIKPDQNLKKSSSRHKSVLVGLKPKTANVALSTERAARPALKLAWPVAASLLYVLMSLQR
jgi:hypothetical protein